MPLTMESALRKDKSSGKGSLEHRHFATIAAIITEISVPDESYRETLAKEFAWSLASTNPRFDKARFLRACGVE